uniref:non-specific serine/threonine protein kinase n=1 Tax=Amphimedon queenslandica TaxID=400682 RepID=A0A1X7TYT6_AMPQE
MTVLCINGLFNLRFLISSLQQIVPFIAHPNIWARYGSVGFIMAAASQLDDIDALCYIAPVVQPFLKYNNILELDNKHHLFYFTPSTKDYTTLSGELTYSSEKIDELKGSSGGHRRTKSDSGTESRSVVVFDKPPSLVRVEQTTCMENLQSLLNHKKELYKKDMQGMDKGYLYYPFYQAPASWAPKGQLVAHIHDHLQAVNKIKVIPDSTYFVSFSDDSTTKIWDVNKMEGLHVINKPRLVYSQQGGKIKTGCYCMGNQSIVAASSNGTIHAFNIDREPNSKQKALKAKDVLRWELDPSLHGSVVEMTEMTCGGQNVLAFVTTKGHLCGLDLRTPNLAWDLENDPRHGLMLSMALDPFQNWIALGTSLGYHIVWDMRFQLPICNWKHEGHGRPYVHRIQQLSSHPNQLQTVLSAASDIYGTHDNELHQLHQTFQSIVVHLLSDNDSNVKRAFLTHSAEKLCTFFGAQKGKTIT